MAEKKLFVGGRLKRLRKDLNLTQARMAEEIGVSTSYLNLLERNQRPVTAQVLIRLAQTYQIDVSNLSAQPDQRLLLALREVAADPALEAQALDNDDLRELVDTHPRAATALVQLHQAYREAALGTADLAGRMEAQGGLDSASGALLPVEEVRDLLHQRNNYFPELEEAAEQFLEEAGLERLNLYGGLVDSLKVRHGVHTRILPFDVLRGALRRYDRHSRRLLLSELLDPAARVFQIAAQLALFEFKDILDALGKQTSLSTREAQRLYRIGLANYFAGALMMPYAAFRQAAETLRYDIDVLSLRFGASFEQICHRLTTLNAKDASGVGFFMVRVDQAGNVSKRFGGQVFHFARSGGACPRWNLWEAFHSPGRIVTQIIELPDGARFFSIARTVARPGAGVHQHSPALVVAIGCPLAQAGRVVYADALNIESQPTITPIGLNCRLCERPGCYQRAFPPLQKRLFIDENRRGISPFSFQEG